MTNAPQDVESELRDRSAFAATANQAEELRAIKDQIAGVFETYLDAFEEGEDIGDPLFDQEVTGPKTLAIFLAEKAVEILLEANG